MTDIEPSGFFVSVNVTEAAKPPNKLWNAFSNVAAEVPDDNVAFTVMTVRGAGVGAVVEVAGPVVEVAGPVVEVAGPVVEVAGPVVEKAGPVERDVAVDDTVPVLSDVAVNVGTMVAVTVPFGKPLVKT